jgi:hypothetical protein
MPTRRDNAHCAHDRPNGEPCRARPRPGRLFCTFHDPELAGKRARGRSKGGVNRSRPAATLPPDAPDLPLKTVADVVAALGETMNQVRTGKLAVNVGNCLGVLAGVLLRAIEGGDLEGRIAALEAGQAQRRRVA